MIKIFCPFCEWEINAGDLDEETICPGCGRRFPVETGDACYQNNSAPLHDVAGLGAG